MITEAEAEAEKEAQPEAVQENESGAGKSRGQWQRRTESGGVLRKTPLTQRNKHKADEVDTSCRSTGEGKRLVL